MGTLLLPLGIFAGWIAGAAMSRRMIRSEVQRLESLIESGNRKSAPAPAAIVPPPAPVIAAIVPPPAPAIAAAVPKPPEPAVAEEVSPEIIMVLTAAVAAFLGKRARIRGARLVRTAPSSAWAQQGRVFVQASHNLGVMHGR
jgi:methylmalonyl-CoA carboxyltransferase large subunit